MKHLAPRLRDMQPAQIAENHPQADSSASRVVALDAAPPRVVHAIGALTESVIRFLVPAMEVLQNARVRQSVIVMDDRGKRGIIERQLPAAVSLAVIDEHAGNWRRYWAWMSAFRDLHSYGALHVLHVHGAAPLTLVAAMGCLDKPRQLLYSPHGCWDAQQPSRWRSMAADLLTLPIHRLHKECVVSSRHAPGHRGFRLRAEPVTAMQPPLQPAFQSISRVPNAEPLVVAASAGKSQRAAMALAQLAVLAGHGAGGAPVFQWSGECEAAGARILHAAGIGAYPDQDPMARANRLSRAMVFVSPGPDLGYPWAVAEAMACGVPVVALDTPKNRRLVIDGVTGFLCRTTQDMLAPVLTLIDRQEIRRSLGDAGRQRILEEFDQEVFARRLLDTYGLADRRARWDESDRRSQPRAWGSGRRA